MTLAVEGYDSMTLAVVTYDSITLAVVGYDSMTLAVVSYDSTTLAVAEFEKLSNVLRNRLKQIQTFLRIMVTFGLNRQDFDWRNKSRRGVLNGVAPIQKTSGWEGEC